MNLEKQDYYHGYFVEYDKRSDTYISLADNFEYIFIITLQDNIVYVNKNLKYTFKNHAADKMTYMKLVFMIYRRYMTKQIIWYYDYVGVYKKLNNHIYSLNKKDISSLNTCTNYTIKIFMIF